jgi:hypothetical protein
MHGHGRSSSQEEEEEEEEEEDTLHQHTGLQFKGEKLVNCYTRRRALYGAET